MDGWTRMDSGPCSCDSLTLLGHWGCLGSTDSREMKVGAVVLGTALECFLPPCRHVIPRSSSSQERLPRTRESVHKPERIASKREMLGWQSKPNWRF